MPRPPRIVYPGQTFHLTPRGNDGRSIFLDDADRVEFLRRLTEIAGRHGWIVYGYCLMDNHIHLLVQVPQCGLSEGMQALLGGYSRWWNRKHRHYGHLFRNRFDSKLVRTEQHLIATVRYIDVNRVFIGSCVRPEQWKWSSYRAHAGLANPPQFLANSEFLRLLSPNPDKARTIYIRFVREGRKPVSDTGLSAPPLSRGSTQEPRRASPPSAPPRAPPG
ncbi:MAG TPA: transposase [Gaiellaceae bacterium]